MTVSELLLMCFSAILIENFIFVRFLGVCPFLGVSGKIDTSISMGMAVTLVMTVSSAITWVFNQYVLVRYEMEYLQTIAFIIVIATMVQAIEIFIKKTSPGLYKSLGVYLPLITTNCAVLGVVVLNKNNIDAMRDAGMRAGIIYAVVNGLASALGFLLMIVIMAGIRERQERCNIPKPFKGFPIALITAGIMSLAFLGFAGFMRG